MCIFVQQQRVLLIALATWVPITSQSQVSVLQALAQKSGCVEKSTQTGAAELSDSEAARCLFKSWYPLSHHWRLTPDYDPKNHGGHETYGELEPEGLETILDRVSEMGAPLSEDDVFADMGSGVGQVTLLAFLKSSARLVVGIELMEERHKLAVRAREKVLETLSGFEGEDIDQASFESRELRLLNGDITDTALYDQWADASVVFSCSSVFDDDLVDAFREALLANLKPGTLVFSLKPLGGDHRDLAPLDAFFVKTSWREDCKIFLYIRNLEPLVLNDLNLAIAESQSVLDDCISWALSGKHFATPDIVQRFCSAFAWKWGERAEHGLTRLDYIWVVPEL